MKIRSDLAAAAKAREDAEALRLWNEAVRRATVAAHEVATARMRTGAVVIASC